jgi:predicted membrane chloride channel (bestrophin family)
MFDNGLMAVDDTFNNAVQKGLHAIDDSAKKGRNFIDNSAQYLRHITVDATAFAADFGVYVVDTSGDMHSYDQAWYKFMQRGWCTPGRSWRRGIVAQASLVALPVSLIAAAWSYVLMSTGLVLEAAELEDGRQGRLVVSAQTPFQGLTFAVAFLITFRTNHSYNRYYKATNDLFHMTAEFTDTASSLCAFSGFRAQPDSHDAVRRFRRTICCFFSLLHAVALEGIRGPAVEKVNLPIVDWELLDAKTRQTLQGYPMKVHLVYHWIEKYIVANIETGVLSIPPPLLTRCWQELAKGVVNFHECMVITEVQFPFIFVQVCDYLLLIHLLVAPLVLPTWCSHPIFAFLFTYIQVFMFWGLNIAAFALENPFGDDEDDLPLIVLQKSINARLVMLLSSEANAVPYLNLPAEATQDVAMAEASFQSTDALEGAQYQIGEHFFDARNGPRVRTTEL